VQQSLREDAPGIREPRANAVHASRPGPITRKVVIRVVAIATLVAIFFSLLGPFDRGPEVLAKRGVAYLAFSWIGSLLGLSSARLLARLGLWRASVWTDGLGTGLIMMAPMSFVVWVGMGLVNGHPTPRTDLPEILWDTALLCIGMSYLAVLLNRRTVVIAAAPPPPKFLERLPLKLRGAEIWAVEAEDHYLRLHTSKGQDLILLRLADAVAELEGIEGMQVHRSWWVSRDAITDAKRGDGRATLTLKDGAEVPVSRTYAAQLREKGWI
jgi:hypothetical protein